MLPYFLVVATGMGKKTNNYYTIDICQRSVKALN